MTKKNILFILITISLGFVIAGCSLEPVDDTYPPGQVIGFTVSRSTIDTVVLNWQNPIDSDLAGIMIRVSTTEYPVDISAGTLLTTEASAPSAERSFTQENATAVAYYYAAFTYDTSDNYSVGENESLNTPKISSVSPVTGSINNSSKFQITFDRAMEPNSVSSKTTLTSSGTDVSGSWGWNADQTIFTFVPSALLSYGGTYVLAVSSEAESASGAAIGANYTFTYTVSQWQTTIVDDSVDAGKYCAIILDPDDKAYIVYYDETNVKLRYAETSGDGWTTTALYDFSGTTYPSSPEGVETNISLATSGTDIYVSFYSPWIDKFLLYKYSGGLWVLEAPSDKAYSGWNTDLLINAGSIYVAYTSAEGSTLTSVSIEVVSRPLDSTNWSSVSEEAAGNYYCPKLHIMSDATEIAFYVPSSQEVRWFDSATTFEATAFSFAGWGKDLYTTFYDKNSQDLYFASGYYQGTSSSTLIDSSGDTGSYSSLVVDSNGRYHIAYYDAANQSLKYATDQSGLWVTQTIDPASGVGKYASIAVDSNNAVHIAYYDETNKHLKYATNAP